MQPFRGLIEGRKQRLAICIGNSCGYSIYPDVNFHIWWTPSSKSALFDDVYAYAKSSSPYSLVHTMSTSTSKNEINPSVLCDYNVKSSSHCSLAHILPTLYLQKTK